MKQKETLRRSSSRSAQTRRGSPGPDEPPGLSCCHCSAQRPSETLYCQISSSDRMRGAEGRGVAPAPLAPCPPWKPDLDVESSSPPARPLPSPAGPSCPLAPGPRVGIPLEPKSAAGPEGRAALSAALFPSRPAAPRWLHTLAPACRPTFPDILRAPGPLASWRAALGSDPAPAPTRQLCRGWGSGEAVVTALFLWAGHPGARFPRRPRAARSSHCAVDRRAAVVTRSHKAPTPQRKTEASGRRCGVAASGRLCPEVPV